VHASGRIMVNNLPIKLGLRHDSSFAYRQAVAVPTPKPAATCANVSPFRR
jgi:hypothetical protein